MIRQKPLNDRNMTSSPDDNIERSSTEEHVILSSRDMSVADHQSPDPSCGRETPELKEKTDAGHSVQKYNLQNETQIRCIPISPRKMSSRVYTPLPFIKRDMPVPEAKHQVDIATHSESIVRIDTQSVEHAQKLPRIYSPLPYSRYNTPYAPVNWQNQVDANVPGEKPIETRVSEERQEDDQQTDDILMLERKVLSEIPALNDSSTRNSPVPPVSATHNEHADTVSTNSEIGMDGTADKKEDCIHIEKISASQERTTSVENIQTENDTKRKENRRKGQLINMKPSEKQQFTIKRKTTAKLVNKGNGRLAKNNKGKAVQAKECSVKEAIDSEGFKEMQELKKVYEAHLKEKEAFEKVIEKRENELNEQLREMDEVMESIYSEHIELEKATGAFADAVKVHTNYKDEASRVMVQHMEQEISSDILSEENAELKVKIRELYDKINDIKERRATGLQELKQDINEIKCAALLLKGKNEEMDVVTQKKMEEFNSLKMFMMDKGISCAEEEKIIEEVEDVAAFPRVSISKSPPLLSSNTIRSGLEIGITDIGNVSPDIGTPRDDNTTESGSLSNRVSSQNLALDGNDIVERNAYGEGFISEGSQKHDHSTDVKVDILKVKPPSAKMSDENNGEGDVPACAIKDEGTSTDRCKSEVPERQMSTVGLIGLPVVGERKSRIPKPLVKSYRSVSKDSEIFKVSEGSSLTNTQIGNHKRDAFVPEDQRHITKPVMGYLDQDIGLRRQKENVISEQSEEMKENKIYWTDDKLTKGSEKKPETVLKRCKKKEIKSKIDTGLKSRLSNVAANKSRNIIGAVRKMNKSATRKDTKKEPALVKHSNRGAITKEQACLSAKKPDLPPLKNMSRTAKNANNVPKSSSSFGNKTSLPNTKPSNQQMKDLNKTSEKRAATHHVLPPIKSSKN